MASPLGRSFSTGQGQGTAQIFDNTNLVNAIARQIQAKKAKQAEEEDYYRQQFAKINKSGVRDIDLKERINPLMDKMYDSYSKIGMARSRAEKLQAQAETDRAKQEVLNAIEGSKQLNVLQQKNRDRVMSLDPNKRYKGWEAKDSELNNYAYDDPRVKDLTAPGIWSAQQYFDAEKTTDKLLKSGTEKFQTGYQTIDGTNTKESKYGYRLAPNAIKDSLHRIAADDVDEYNNYISNYQKGFDQKLKSGDKRDIELAKQYGFRNYDPNSIDDFVALNVFAANRGRHDLERESRATATIPKPDKGDGDSDGGGSFGETYSGGLRNPVGYVGTQTKTAARVNGELIQKANTVNRIPVVNETPFTKTMLVDVGSAPYWDVKKGDWVNEPTSKTVQIRTSGMVDIPTYTTASGKVITIPESGYNQEWLSKNGVKEIEYKPMMKASYKDGNTVKNVLIPLESMPSNIASGKKEHQALTQHTQGGFSAQGSQPIVKKTTEVVKNTEPKVSTFIVNGKTYNIPSNEVAEFKKAFPNAKKK